VAHPKNYIDKKYVKAFGVTHLAWNEGYLDGLSYDDWQIFLIFPPSSLYILPPTLVDLLKMPGVAAVDLYKAAHYQHMANQIKKALSKSLKDGEGSSVVVKSKVFDWIKNAVTKVNRN
jgi:hypothetical protein